MISRDTAEHYVWGNQCDGWKLVNTPDLTVIQERMPPGTSEVRHFHQKARQFFFVLSGVATMELNGEREQIGTGLGLEIPPGQPHQILNGTDSVLEFLVISQPTPAGDRIIS